MGEFHWKTWSLTGTPHFIDHLRCSVILFYINDLPDHINSQVCLFADDCSMYCSITSDSSHLKNKPWILGLCMGDKIQCHKMLHHVNFQEKAIYICLHSLRAHTRKCWIMQISGNQHSISEDLKWETYISEVCSKASRTLRFAETCINAIRN